MSEDRFDRGAARGWMQTQLGQAPGLLQVVISSNWGGRKAVDTVDEAVDFAAQADRTRPAGVYLRATTLRDAPAPLQCGGPAQSLTLPGLWAGVDFDGPGHAPPVGSLPLSAGEAAACRIVAEAGLPDPSVSVHSGGRLYPWWLLTRPHVLGEDRAAVEELSRNWQGAIGARAQRLGFYYGTGVGDLARVLRLVGSVNRKTPQPRPCRIFEEHDHLFEFEELRAALDAVSLRPRRTGGVTGRARPESSARPFDALAESARRCDLLQPAGWELVGYERAGGQLWLRPTRPREPPASTYSARTDHNGVPTLVVYSENAGRPSGSGQRLTMGRVFAHLHYGGTSARRARAA